MNKKETWIFILILAIAIFFRFYLIGKMPGGLFPDEAANGLDINNIFKGHFQPFFPRGNGREALFFYFEALSTLIFGRGFWQFHIVSATIGVVSIISVFLLSKQLYGTKTGLLASFLMAVGTWHIVLSRTALRAIQTPLYTTITLYFITKTLTANTKKAQLWNALFSGIFFSLGFYTYIAYRIMVVILGFILVLLLIVDWKQQYIWVKKYAQAFYVAIAAAFVTFIPLGYYFLKNPGAFIGRAGQVSIFNPDLNHGHLIQTFIMVTFESLRAYFIDGDLNWRQNISGQAMLSPLYNIFFGIGLVVLTILTIRFVVRVFSYDPKKGPFNLSDLKYVTIVTLFWGMLIPEISTNEGIPHGLRSIGTLAPAYIISAIALMYFARKVLSVWHHRFMEYIYTAVAVLFFASLIYLSYTQYFVYAYGVPDNYMAFRSDLSTVSDYLNKHPDPHHTFLILDLYSVQTVDYLTTPTGNPYITVDPANSHSLHLQKGDEVIFTASTFPDSVTFTKYHKNIVLDQALKNRLGLLDMFAYKITADDSSISYTHTADYSFNIINFGDRVDFSWKNIQFDPWEMKIWQCTDPTCTTETLLKDENQNDYFANNDYIITDTTKANMYIHPVAYDTKGNVLKNYGVITVNQYK